MALGKKKQAQATPRRRLQQHEVAEETQASSQFRRNQTLSSYRHNTPEESARHKAHDLTVRRRRLGGIFSIVLLAAVLLMLLLWQLIAQVHLTTSTKPLSVRFDTSVYERSINDYLALNPAQRLRFALDERALSDYVSSHLPEVEKIGVSGSAGLAQANFAITFRTPVAGWQINSRQNYVDARGVVFEKNYYTSPGLQIVDESGIRPEQGTAVASSRLLGFLGHVVAGAGERGYTVTQAILPAETTRQLDIYVKGSPSRIKFSIDRGAGEQVEDMDRVIRFLSSRHVKPKYIDVRVAGKAAYR